ncbi:MAG: GDYXXLXY domain-containing protein [Planctomycetota bacterium]|jgi:uncharacterized membrane-anchored protein
MKTAVYWGTAALVLVAANGLIAHKEYVLANGRTVLFRLAPRDPRSLIQGDYMVLRYRIASRASHSELRNEPDGRIVVRLDPNSVATFVRVHAGEPLAAEEQLVRYRWRRGLRLGAESFFFQEGHAERYERARYGELKVTPGGTAVLVGLRGESFERLGARAGSGDG